ncbi:hypothetical protein [Polyangium mundeleinium]|uniref:GyrI-like small molecule binding domain-containing protein n=1 Tax=Polyangium mundeleinium TaxID=2995306 RepID=A0ABT5EKP1_9BACT|nr:hypothetical protein [Polyangium mundeleinium]MDC0741922.1 hypothetical protein [Polyangium mundeleinium]
MTTQPGNLSAFVDGVALPEEAARNLWTRFSEWMGEHKGDMEGFGKINGYTQITPEYRGGRAVLIAYTKEPPPAPPQTKPAGKGGGARRGGRAGGGGRR